ncbi:MAG: MMPL family transporter, partial [Nitrospinaceae bacterium]|nr:MMPL family transporter [Nitrospinaceae bacterium]NIR53458.1 MMPL family transporter [Nitrospinaceae bacterium]NIS83861.1 MMPL family transporter [Nitrospinaceae bacterium]NIT80652.1 MMPL family transporter [Nitrospinaceae bacterium]NIU42980.1 MMPL family transporter [Nitrospinaceae bacterium]
MIDHPRLSLALIGLMMLVAGFHVTDFKLDASSDSLVLENDEDLRYYRSINKVYKGEDFLVITYTPFKGLMSDESIEGLKNLKEDLLKVDRIESVTSILDVPLFNSPRITLSDLRDNVRTLSTPGLDKSLALKEFTESPIYRKLLVSPDGKTTALLATYKRDEKYFSLLETRNDLRLKKREQGLTAEETETLNKVSREFKAYLAEVLTRQSREVKQVRAILDPYRDRAKIFLGGVPMITSDMISYIESDLSIFGYAVSGLMILVMWLFFRAKRWVALPMLVCGISVWVMVGALGWLDWRVTVISSNFISIMIIITISLIIHLIVRYGELYAENPGEDPKTLVRETVRFMFAPCFYTAITTIVAFCSLVVSEIRPVIDFGWIMTLGISLAFVTSFIFFPSFLRMMKPKGSVSGDDLTKRLTHTIARITIHQRNRIFGLFVLLAVVSGFGITRVGVDNRFIDYFKDTTEIYQGMSVIDTQLGGTTPLQIVIGPDQQYFEYLKMLEEEKALEEEDPFAEEMEEQEENFWFHPNQLKEVEEIHDYLETLPEIGKVLSMGTTLKIVRFLNSDEMPEDYDLAIYRKVLPAHAKKSFIDPYLSPDANQIRIIMRIEETDPHLNRGKLIEKIRRHLVDEMGIAEDRIRFTGMAVLFNNMLQSLYKSQILTLGMVFIAILLMFIILFRRIRLSFLAVIPNVFSALMILGVMGLFGIPLDMMTITIAAITIGIGVDDTIHYIHRFKREFAKDTCYSESVIRCHGSIGRAIYYTSITVTVGFSILTLSNFIPTIYFGMLTGLAMILALTGNLFLLPVLIAR